MQSREGTIHTRFVLISDTHNTPLFESSDKKHSFRKTLPAADVLIHAGDLTNRGTKKQHDVTFKILAEAAAEIKLVIAGNHDVTLDKEYYRKGLHERLQMTRKSYQGDAACQEVQQEAEDLMNDVRELWTGERAKSQNIHFLDEGVHEFVLTNGSKFVVYASPFTPEFCNWAFAYPRELDRYNDLSTQKHDTIISSRSSVIPSHPSIDIIVTHGPPAAVLDKCEDGKLAGCKNLRMAVERSRPRLHVFGHIHECHGAEFINWSKGTVQPLSAPKDHMTQNRGWIGVDTTGRKSQSTFESLDLLSKNGEELKFGEETLFVNAAIMDQNFRPRNAPWIVDMLLPAAQ